MTQKISSRDIISPAVKIASEALPIEFEFEGVKYRIRQPTDDELDESYWLQSLVSKVTRELPDVKALKGLPCTDEARDEILSEIHYYEALFRTFDESETNRRNKLMEMISSLQKRLSKLTLIEEVVLEKATLARDRYLASILLCDESGRQVIQEPRSEEGLTNWENIRRPLKDAARPYIWKMLRIIDELPFD